MQLPFIKNQSTQKNFYLSLLIKPHKISVILFEEEGGSLSILSTNENIVEENTAEIPVDDLLKSVDQAISFVERSLPDGASVEKTIFSLPFDWIIESKIKPDHLDRLKIVCKALELTPIGYLTSIEAIVHFLEKSEGAPVSAIFIDISGDQIYAYLVRAGKIIDSESSSNVDKLAESLEGIFQKFVNSDVLPAKIILLDNGATSDIQQDLLSHKWSSSIRFMHVPQVATLEKGFENEAMINGVATQMELEVHSNVRSPMDTNPQEVLEEVAPADFGFFREGDEKIENISEEENAGKSNISELDNSEEVSTFAKSVDEPDINYFKEGDITNTPNQNADNISNTQKFGFSFADMLGIVKKFKMPSKISFSQFTSGPLKSKLIIGLVGVIIAVVIFLFLYYGFILRAEVTVFSDMKMINKSTPVTFSQNNSEDSIRLTSQEMESEGDLSANSTGKKETGERAKGSITLYNKTEDKKTFNKGTKIIGPNNLEFDLLDDVNIASTSSFATSLSNASGKVEAAKFGKEYNLPSGSNFTIKGVSASNFIGKNSDAIVGGTSKTTTVVSKKDLDSLLENLTEKLESEMIAKAKSSGGSQISIFPKSLSSEVLEKTYSRKEGDEAESIDLSAKIKFNIGQYDKSDVERYVDNLSKDEVPENYKLKDDSKIEIVDIEVDGEEASATLKINARYTPEIDNSKLSSEITGKSINFAEKKIKSVSGVNDAIINLKNTLPLLPKLLPSNSKNIKIKIKS